MNEKKIIRGMKNIVKELDMMKKEFTKNSALERAKKTGVIDYTEVLRDMTIVRSLNNITEEVLIATKIAVRSKKDIELDCEWEGKTTQEKVMKEFL